MKYVILIALLASLVFIVAHPHPADGHLFEVDTDQIAGYWWMVEVDYQNGDRDTLSLSRTLCIEHSTELILTTAGCLENANHYWAEPFACGVRKFRTLTSKVFH